jgi:hypothetical protein
MQVIVNKEQKDIPVSFEGNDYTFVAGKPVQVEDNLYEFVKELLPMCFDFKPELKKIDKVEELVKVPTKAIFIGGKFGIQSESLPNAKFPNMNVEVADETPESGKTDKSGVEWYGGGLEDDKI